MDSNTVTALAWLLAICSGLMAGVYLAFSSFIMRSFAALDTAAAINAMNAINTCILRSLFMPLFFGSTLVAALLCGAGIRHWNTPGAFQAVSAGLIYALGMFAVTAGFNVPLNNALAKAQAGNNEARKAWTAYLSRWTRWNTIRTIASAVTMILCMQIINISS